MSKYRLQKIDSLLFPSHKYLTADDECYFFMGYTPLWVAKTPENDLIMNFKKGVDKKGRSEWKWKGSAIGIISDLFIQNLAPIVSPNTILVPIPPSKIKADPLYDDRLIQVVTNFCKTNANAELREIISATANMTPTHEAKKSPDEILPFLTTDQALCQNQKENIIIVDDVITEGAHYKACQTLLQPEFPQANIIGLFIARTVH